MDRRKALKQMGIVSAGLFILQSCDFSKKEGQESIFTSNENEILSDLTNAILPTKGTKVETPDTRTDFIETVVSECYSADDIQKFKTGLAKIGALKGEDGSFPFEDLTNSDNESIKMSYDTVRQLSIQHFTSSEYYMTEVIGWEFIPSRYNPCVTI